jgi:hypothetical protein
MIPGTRACPAEGTPFMRQAETYGPTTRTLGHNRGGQLCEARLITARRPADLDGLRPTRSPARPPIADTCAYSPLSFLRRVTGLVALRAPTMCCRSRGVSRVWVFRFLSGTQAGELPHRLNMRPCGSMGRPAPGGLLFPARGTVATALIAPVIPSGQPVGLCARMRKGEHYPIGEGQDRPRLFRCP